MAQSFADALRRGAGLLLTQALIGFALLQGAAAQTDVAAVRAGALAKPPARELLARQLELRAQTRSDQALEAAARLGWPVRGKTPDGRGYELYALNAGRPLYRITCNADAAISSAADRLRRTAPYDVDGAGLRIGIWDEGSPRTSHVEFEERIANGDTAVNLSDHSTHVAGTVGAAGVDPEAMGMAPGADLVAFDWSKDAAEMAWNAAAAPGDAETGKFALSNHSYGIASGWEFGNWGGYYRMHWFGLPGEAEDRYFGMYEEEAAEWDAVCYAAPWFLPVRAAGNDRNDDTPTVGGEFYYLVDPDNAEFPSAWETAIHDPETDPKADGEYRNGYETIATAGCSKNVLTVGSVTDAAFEGLRDLTWSQMTSYSSWGPTDDGRIKPDIVANGNSLFSTLANSNTAYGRMSGTSMASPNACGSAALLVDYYRRLFPGQAMRAATLKALIIHTTDDMGETGPDYQHGWGLINALAAADLLTTHSVHPALNHLVESRLDAENPTRAFSLDPLQNTRLQVTLVWTDPPAQPINALNNATPRLVNDLDLRLVAPDGTEHLPWTLDPSAPAAPAVPGDNTLDNVEQVVADTTETTGTWTLRVSHKSSLTHDEQSFSLIVTGLRLEALFVAPEEPAERAGPQGGSFETIEPWLWHVRNLGGLPLPWSVAEAPEWLELSETSGTLAAGGETAVLGHPATEAELLDAGRYEGIVRFQNDSLGSTWDRPVALEVRPPVALRWAAVPESWDTGRALEVTIEAIDEAGEVVRALEDDAFFSAWVGPGPRDVGAAGAILSPLPLDTEHEQSRTQAIYHADEIATSGSITGLALRVEAPPAGDLDKWTVRLRETDRAAFDPLVKWEEDGYAQVLQTNLAVDQTGWVTLRFQHAFTYRGLRNLLVDMSFSNTRWAASGLCQTFATPVYRTMHGSLDEAEPLHPADWSGSLPYHTFLRQAPTVRFIFGEPVTVSPAVVGPIEKGVWRGIVVVEQPGDDIRLRAETIGGLVGFSQPLRVNEWSPAETGVPASTSVLYD